MTAVESVENLIAEAKEIVGKMPNAENVAQLKGRVERANNILGNLPNIFNAFTANLDIVSGSIGKNTALVSTLKESLRNLIEKTKDNATIMDIITKFMNQFDSIFKSGDSSLKTMIESKEKLDGLIISLEQEIEGKESSAQIDSIRKSLNDLTTAYKSILIPVVEQGMQAQQDAPFELSGEAVTDEEIEQQNQVIVARDARRAAAIRPPKDSGSTGGKRRKSKRKTKKGGRKRKSKKRKSRRKRKSKRKSKKKSKRTKKR